jgi:hypothetical protein
MTTTQNNPFKNLNLVTIDKPEGSMVFEMEEEGTMAMVEWMLAMTGGEGSLAKVTLNRAPSNPQEVYGLLVSACDLGSQPLPVTEWSASLDRLTWLWKGRWVEVHISFPDEAGPTWEVRVDWRSGTDRPSQLISRFLKKGLEHGKVV